MAEDASTDAAADIDNRRPTVVDVGLPVLMGSPEDLSPSAPAADMIGKEAWVDLGPGSGEQIKGGNFLN